ncbi:PaaI family thioesterase [Ktedonosporobacter rubrisoli]|uniref:PaaI family thioesterase n=1 Tax=Ktedonosporobacter rubrisoli TaxID=2509675 RepID=A0A4V0YZC5_KTERU|nr:PaaI family thioesterase [Ktedonosporobacter rubrisoli]QBD79241.1 PaaI family thioesterase [Ktedonosporobacter rubrisoli]
MTHLPENQRTRTITWQDPLPVLQQGRELSGLQYMQAVKSGQLPPPPMMELMGVWISEVNEERIVFAVEPAEYHYNPLGVVHGGLAATLLDSAMGCAVHVALPANVSYTTLELKVNLVRALTRSTGVVYGEGKVLHLGGRIATAEGRVFDANGKLYAHGTTTCLIMRP